MSKKAQNPMLPLEWNVPDPEAHVFSDGNLYIYGSYDNSKEHFCSEQYYVVSTSDLQNWEVSNTSFNSSQTNWSKKSKPKSTIEDVKHFDELPIHIKNMIPDYAKDYPIEQIKEAIKEHTQTNVPDKVLLYAPDAIEKNGTYYLYFCMSDESEGVAVSSSPNGPFCYPQKLNVEGIDPAVFIDDDGQAYYYWGQLEANGAKLSDDMLSIDEDSIKYKIIDETNHGFHEGFSMRKIGYTYYAVFADSTRGRPTALGYATSDNPMGPFTYKGIIIDNQNCDPKSWNNHGSIEQFNGQWYVFYHRSFGNSDKNRRLCAEPITIDSDGTIDEVVMTSQGIGNSFLVGEEIPAYKICEVTGGAYIQEEINNPKLVIPKNEVASAVIRYLQVDKQVSEIAVKAEGNYEVAIYANDKLIGTGNSSYSIIKTNLNTGQYEIKLEFKKAENGYLSSVIFK